MNQDILELSEAEFESATHGGVTLVDFSTPWCGPCRMQDVVLRDVAAELSGQVTIAKVNVDEHHELAARLGVRAMPTLLLFKDGVTVAHFTGLQRKETLLKAIRSARGVAA